jgi:hypothetical protein
MTAQPAISEVNAVVGQPEDNPDVRVERSVRRAGNSHIDATVQRSTERTASDETVERSTRRSAFIMDAVVERSTDKAPPPIPDGQMERSTNRSIWRNE